MPSTVQAIVCTPFLDRSRAFYSQVFGAVEVSRMPAEGPIFYLGLQIGNSDVGLVVNEEVEVGTPTRVLLSIAVDDVDRVATLVTEAGGQVLAPAEDMPWGQRVAHTLDPDGNRINLTQEL